MMPGNWRSGSPKLPNFRKGSEVGQKGRRTTRGARVRATQSTLVLKAGVTLAVRLTIGAGVFVLAPDLAAAQEFSLSLGDQGTLTQTSIGLIGLITLLSLVPGLLVMITCFPFIVTVMSILRQAIGLQQAPPGMLIVSLSLFLTYFIMDPVLQRAWEEGLRPLSEGSVDFEQGLTQALAPFREFMAARIDPETFAELLALRPEQAADQAGGPDAPLSLLVPSFLLSEIERAFQIGFLIFLPFLIIDLVVAAILMSMGMMMVPPAMVALPFKLAFFVVADGWTLLSSALVRSYF